MKGSPCTHAAPASCPDCDGTTAELIDEQTESLLDLDAPEEVAA